MYSVRNLELSDKKTQIVKSVSNEPDYKTSLYSFHSLP